MKFLGARRGSLAALAVGVAILALYVALQPGPKPESVEVAPTTTTILPTTTINPHEELCALAREFEESARDQDAPTVARLAEAFYDRARHFAPPEIKPEYEAAADYYIEYNNIGEQYGYDFLTALASPDGERYLALTFGEPLGVNPARFSAAVQCEVELPPAPTITTTTTTRPRTTLPPATTPPETTPEAPTAPPATPATTPATTPTAPATAPGGPGRPGGPGGPGRPGGPGGPGA